VKSAAVTQQEQRKFLATHLEAVELMQEASCASARTGLEVVSATLANLVIGD